MFKLKFKFLKLQLKQRKLFLNVDIKKKTFRTLDLNKKIAT